MPTVNCLRAIGCEHDAANKNVSNRKDHRNGKAMLMNAHLYSYKSSKINLQRRQIALTLMSPLEVHGAIEC